MKYSNTQPSTDPSAAMNAYSGIRAGFCMDNWISSKSLIIGNVSTEESRNEIRSNPGAPSPLANATTFCFHPLKPVAKGNSSGEGPENCQVVALALAGAERPARNYCANAARSK